TNYTQISIFSASMAIYETLLSEFGNEIIKPNILLGHSLGEYSALVAGNLISITDASKLIKIRGELMHSSIEPNVSGMAAIIGKNADFIDDLIDKNNLKIVIANDNSPMQVVVSGLIEDINSSEQVFFENGVKRYVKLNVSAAFHSNFMNEAQSKLINEIDKINFKNTNLPIISNYDSTINSHKDSIIYALKNQMANRVRWTDSIKKLEETDISQIIEIGPGKVLSGLITRITKKFDIKSIENIEDLKKFN
ncbi:ACP S-malonyltransferase, partial [Pelagibacteraceae bacterium]|nr:ACP S-malonyltransferase [Pelagibacteraceae bacterium]